VLHESSPQQVIAILTMSDDERPFRGNHQNFIDLIKTGRDRGVMVYVTRVQDLKLGQKRINGFVYHPESRTWNQILVPFPHVVYNRIPNRKDEQQPEVQQLLKACLKHSKLRLFNPTFFYKWSLFEWLHKSKITRKYVPVTRRLSQISDLENVLAQFQVVYLKPVKGKAGAGIMRVEHSQLKHGPYILRVQATKKSHVTTYSTLSKLWSTVRKASGSEEYIVQQGISLTTYEDRPFDLRVLVQKNGQGEWSISGVGARVAGKSSITTHVPRGGSIQDPEMVLTAALGAEPARRTLIKTRLAALSIARQIEKASGHTLGEMSMDLGVDTTGQLWFFEANSRPMKFDEPDIRKRSLERLIEFSQYISKSKKKSR
jgi:hypothetical protein